jgi:large subunit ribosomal protein L25
MDVEIQIENRLAQSKGETNRLRIAGKVPVVIYSQKKTAENATISAVDFAAVLRNVESGFLPTTTFKLVDASGKARRAIIKDIQYHVTTYNVIHLDFQELHDDVDVSVKVPVECTGQVDCVGVKLGGFLRPVMRHVRVRCKPKVLPRSFQVDVAALGLNQLKQIKDLDIPKGVQVLNNMSDTIVTVVKR